MFVEYPFQVSILASYFILILALLWRISPQLKQCVHNVTPEIGLFLGLAVVSFIATWTYMFKFFAFSYSEWRDVAGYRYGLEGMGFLNAISYWLNDVSLFDSAWRQVCVGAWQWLWSHQLCSLTVAVWTPILAIEGIDILLKEREREGKKKDKTRGFTDKLFQVLNVVFLTFGHT